MTALTAFQSALSTCGASPVDIVCLGDSITEGMVATHREDAWPQRLRDQLRQARFSGLTRGGVGYCPSYSVSSSVGDFWHKSDASIVDPGLGVGLGVRALKVPTGSTVSLGWTGTGLDLLAVQQPDATFTYALDGAAPVAVDLTGPLAGGRVIPIRGLCETPHTIVVAGANGGSAYLEGGMTYRGDESYGVRVWEAGHSGWMCSDFSASHATWQASLLAVPNPKLVIVCLGANEYEKAVTSAQYGRNLDALLTTLQADLAGKACSFLIMSPHARIPLSGRANQSYYEAQAQTVADNHGAAYLSMTPVIGDCQTAINAGYLQSGYGIHPTTSGHLKYANALTSFVTS